MPLKPASRFVAYYRVSTAQQGRSGLGLEAQREAVRVFIGGGSGALAEEFTEVETGKNADRPQLEQTRLSSRWRKMVAHTGPLSATSIPAPTRTRKFPTCARPRKSVASPSSA